MIQKTPDDPDGSPNARVWHPIGTGTNAYCDVGINLPGIMEDLSKGTYDGMHSLSDSVSQALAHVAKENNTTLAGVH